MPKTFPFTTELPEDVEKVLSEDSISPKPVIAAEVMGLAPRLPVTVDPGVVVMPDLDKMAKSAALPSWTRFKAGAVGALVGE